MEQPQIILFVAMAVACFHFLRSLLVLFHLGRPVLNKLPSYLGTTTNAMEGTDVSSEPKRGMDGMTQVMECVGDTSQPSVTDAGCSFVADSRYPDECSNNVEPPDDRMSKSEHARRVHQLEEMNAILQQKIIWLQHELRQSDACLAFKKDEYNTLIGAVRNFFGIFKPHEEASAAAVSFIKAEGNFYQQVACMQDFLSYLVLDRKFGIKYQRRKKKLSPEPTTNQDI
ncbi:uncharacterized protein LOC101769081 isoform X2 [Setaria italica]|uniref:uncharacterized protein LOC101769081 isoform X2 n=1 Tax=Setaria italica TaxID=4555 RepID=UPI000BE4C462|nr:uncharacterized protein LOC101769081 isoform X2 [Setaria italica]